MVSYSQIFLQVTRLAKAGFLDVISILLSFFHANVSSWVNLSLMCKGRNTLALHLLKIKGVKPFIK